MISQTQFENDSKTKVNDRQQQNICSDIDCGCWSRGVDGTAREVVVVVVVFALPVGTPVRCALCTFFRTEGVTRESVQFNWMRERRGEGDVSGAGGHVALSLYCRCVVAYE